MKIANPTLYKIFSGSFKNISNMFKTEINGRNYEKLVKNHPVQIPDNFKLFNKIHLFIDFAFFYIF